MRSKRTQPEQARRTALNALRTALLVAATAFTYTMVVAVPHHTTSLARDWLVFGGLTTLGIAYATWGAIKNRSVLVGLLGPTEFLLITPVGFLLLRYPVHLPTAPSLLLALALVALALYPWTRVDQIRRAVWQRTGIT